MARQREFDKQHVLHAAADTFSKFGYAGTSIDMLVEATSLQRGSLYKAFSSKAGLFCAALTDEVDRIDKSSDKTISIDLLIVAIWERASLDTEVFSLVTKALEYMTSKGISISDTFYKRMSERAQLPAHLHEYNKENVW